MHKHMHLHIHAHVHLQTRIFVYISIFMYKSACACACHTQKTGLWITEYPKALPRNRVKFRKPSYTQKRLFWMGTQEPQVTGKGRRNIMSFSLKENKAHSWNFLKKEFYPQVTHVNEINLSIHALKLLPLWMWLKTSNSSHLSCWCRRRHRPPSSQVLIYLWSCLQDGGEIPNSVNFFQMIKPGNSSSVWQILSLPQRP